MIYWSVFFILIILGAIMALSMLGLWFTAVMPGIDRWNRRFFLIFFIVLMLGDLSGLCDMVLFLFSAPIAVFKPLLVLECLFLALPIPMLTAYLLHYCEEDIRTSKLFRAARILWAVYFVLVISGLFTDAFFYIQPDRNYSRGPWFPLLLLPMLATVMLDLAGLIRRRKRFSQRVFRSFLIALVPLTGVLFVHMFVDVVVLVDICYIVFAYPVFNFTLYDQIEHDLQRQHEMAKQQHEIAQQQLEIANQRASIMVLQMRPHFIYNTLTSIYCLCSDNPKLAQQIVMDFTTYLRKNFTAIASAKPIPFSQELEHTRAYLAVEQARFSNSLRVDYDTPHTWFRIPPLTLQPIVENAIKHGRDPYSGLLHISIRTRHKVGLQSNPSMQDFQENPARPLTGNRTDYGAEIVVADNGRGFSPDDRGEPHIALKNIEQRLALMCSGSLTIKLGDGVGTVVTITIPDSAARQ